MFRRTAKTQVEIQTVEALYASTLEMVKGAGRSGDAKGATDLVNRLWA